MRDKEELLKVFMDNTHQFDTGLCAWNFLLFCISKLSKEEYFFIDELIKNNISFETADLYDGIIYYWPKGDIEPRIEFLKKHLKQ